MVIDTHVHPGFLEELEISDEQLKYAQNMMGLHKTHRIRLEHWEKACRCAEIDKLFLLPLDLTTTTGGYLGTNEQVAEAVAINPQRFIGFASVDPAREDALEVLKKAFVELKLCGLKLHPSKQKFYPDDTKMDKIYELCIEYNKPIIFHSGVSMEPDTLTKYAHPLRFEEVAARFPKLRFCLAHFGWPWVREVCMLMLKYRNVYTDTAFLYFDNPKEFYAQSFGVDIGPYWIERSLRHQVMFGSDEPRLEQIRMIKAIREMNLRESTKEMILGGNALDFLKGGREHD
ncbi:MAG: amidohydrolase family protein [Herbinix sp.]|nr:amidohydrolase family protein [Herbinix sp.]